MILTYENEGAAVPYGHIWIFRTMEPPRGFLSGIITDAAEIYGVSEGEIKGNSRERRIVRARQYVFYHGMRRTSLGCKEIGRRVGGKHHTSVLYGAYCHAKRHGMLYAHTTCWKGQNKVAYEGPEPTR